MIFSSFKPQKKKYKSRLRSFLEATNIIVVSVQEIEEQRGSQKKAVKSHSLDVVLQ